MNKFDLYKIADSHLDYNENDAKALTVYIGDLEKKLATYDGLLNKLKIFTSILNERRFSFKAVEISADFGMQFVSSKGKNLSLSQLSSGEKHQIILLFELIFNTKENMIILIDEPELSLHVTWQKEFLGDLQAITGVNGCQVVIATHSPSIINDRWDLVISLQK